MVRLDGGSHPAAPALLVAAAREAGDLRGVRVWLERERDAVLGVPGLSTTPRACRAAQDALRGAFRRGLHVVDLPRAFAERFGLTDRRLFYDYCHLTPEGMAAAMEAVAEVLRPLVGRAPKRAARLRALRPRARAEARLAAAIHTARSGGSDELVEFQLAEALREDPSLAALVEDLLMGGLDGGPIRMSAVFERVVRARRRALARYLWRVRDERATLAHLPLAFVGAAVRLLEGRGGRRGRGGDSSSNSASGTTDGGGLPPGPTDPPPGL